MSKKNRRGSDKKSLKREKFHLKLSGVSTAVVLALSSLVSSAYAADDEWGTNVEVFTAPGDNRWLSGVRALMPVVQDEDSMTYVDGRWIYSDNDTKEYNLGVGHRMLTEDNRIIGGYLFFDHRRTLHSNKFNQITLGAESKGEHWDFGANYYHPLGDDDHKIGINQNSGQFSGSSILISNMVEEAMRGFDVEVGRLIPMIPWETRAYIKGYHFDADVADSATGWQARIETRPYKNITLALSHKHDDLFDTDTRLEVRYSFGYEHVMEKRTVRERMMEFADRDIDVVDTGGLDVEDITDYSNPIDITSEIAPNGIVHVDQNAANGGDGSNERRFNTLDDALASASCDGECLIFVHDGTSLQGDYTLGAGNKLVGQGMPFYGTTSGVPTPFANGDGHALSLTSDNLVGGIGFNVSGRGSAAIFSKSASGNIVIRDNVITNPTGQGIRLNISGEDSNVSIRNNTIGAESDPVGASGITVFVNNSDSGSSITSVVDISGNSVHSSGSGKNDGGIKLILDGSSTASIQQNAQIVNNTVNVSEIGTPGIILRNAASGAEKMVQTVDVSDNNVTARNIALRVNMNDSGSAIVQNVTGSGNTFNITSPNGNGNAVRISSGPGPFIDNNTSGQSVIMTDTILNLTTGVNAGWNDALGTCSVNGTDCTTGGDG